MKQYDRFTVKYQVSVFLTHTVQMKHFLSIDELKDELLLNPHGSDETCLQKR